MATESGENKYDRYGRPALDFIFTGIKKSLKDRSGNRQLQFTRNSVGTYVDENGLIQSATSGEARFDHNPTTGESLGLLVEEARTNSQTYSTHLASNSWSTADATAVPNAALAPDGTFTALRLVENSANAVHNYAINYTEETTSSLTIFAKEGARRYLHIAVSGNIGIFTYSIIIDLRTAVINDPKFFNGTPISSSSATMCANGWVKISVSSNKSRYWKVSISTASVHTNFDTDYGQETYAGDGTSDLFLWGIQYEAGSFPTSYIPTPATFTGRASTATYYNSAGVIQTAGSGVARDNAYFPDENGVFRSAGLLLEAAGTNRHTYSEQFDNAAWGKYGVTITANATTAPDGTTTADKLASTSGAALLLLQQGDYTVTNGASYTRTVFAKAAEISTLIIQISYTSVGTVFVQVNLLDGTATNGGVVTALANGWYRISYSYIQAGTLSDFYFVLPANTVAGNGVYIWGAQLEASPYPTSYIPTVASTVTRAADTSTSSTVTRAADVCTVTNSNIYDTDSFTIINQPFGASTNDGSELTLFDGPEPIKRATVYSTDLSQTNVNAAAGKTDEFWRWRVLGSSFALPNFTTDGQVTVDWGDGTIETLTTATHTFSNGGGYHDIGFRLDSGTYFRPHNNNNASIGPKVVALGPAPESMKLNAYVAFAGCSNLEAFDATVDPTGGTDFNSAWSGCSSLTSFPLIDTSSGTNFAQAWFYCSSLTSFPLINTSAGTNFSLAWTSCSSLTSFPLINTGAGTNFSNAWSGCSSLTSFPLINTAAGTNFTYAWYNCNSLTSFPLINTAAGTNFSLAWYNCTSLTDFPANFFDSWTGTPVANCFFNAWDGCSALTATSVENILNSIDTSGQSAPASGVDITIDYNAGTGTPSVATAITNLKSRGWTITLNGVAQ
jgi:hypothetical protein